MQIKRYIVFSLFFILMLSAICYAVDNDSLLTPQNTIEIHNEPKKNTNSDYFNLANIVDTFLNSAQETEAEPIIDEKTKIRQEFIQTSSKFNQGNVKVAYDEYIDLIDKIDNDTALLTLSKVFYEIGFFSLAHKTNDKIINKNQFQEAINDLNKSYSPKIELTKDDEINFAKQYSSIYFENQAQEVAQELSGKKSEINKNDYAQFMLSRAYFEQKQYSQAHSAINKAISINPENLNYQIFKIDILLNQKKYKEAKKLIDKMKVTSNFAPVVEIKKQVVLASLTKDEKEKKYYIASKSYLEGNFEKTKKDCQNILNFDKDNDKILSLYAKSELALGNIERSNVYFVNSYKIEKNNLDTIIGLGDIRFLHGDYKNAVKSYKKAYKKDKTNYETIIKLANAQRLYGKNQKELKKLEILLDKIPSSEAGAYYRSAISIAQKNDVLKEEYLKRALTLNPLYENALGELIELYLKNKNYITAKGLIYNASFTLEKNYYYYYLCGLYNQAMNKKNDAIQFYKTSLNLNPNFEVANIKLLKLIPDKIDEEI